MKGGPCNTDSQYWDHDANEFPNAAGFDWCSRLGMYQYIPRRCETVLLWIERLVMEADSAALARHQNVKTFNPKLCSSESISSSTLSILS